MEAEDEVWCCRTGASSLADVHRGAPGAMGGAEGVSEGSPPNTNPWTTQQHTAADYIKLHQTRSCAENLKTNQKTQLEPG